MSKRTGSVESILLVAGKPVTFSSLAKLLSCKSEDIKKSVQELEERYNTDESGIHVMVNDNKVQFTTNPRYKETVSDFVKDETTGELTKPSLETLTIIAYRQPVSKEELEQIRGVNCSLILRNLLIRGLVESHEERGGLVTTYSVTMDFLRHLGVNNVSELPEYNRLHDHEKLEAALSGNDGEEKSDGKQEG